VYPSKEQRKLLPSCIMHKKLTRLVSVGAEQTRAHALANAKNGGNREAWIRHKTGLPQIEFAQCTDPIARFTIEPNACGNMWKHGKFIH